MAANVNFLFRIGSKLKVKVAIERKYLTNHNYLTLDCNHINV